MLRLWPEQITVGLFPGHCWLRRRGETSELACANQADGAALAGAFSALLEQAAALRGARLDVVVTDQVARIATLPWQDGLRNQGEWHAYARATLNTIGLPLDDAWVSVSGMRRYREQGLATALPVALLTALEETAQRHAARLRTVMPLSSAAYWSPRRWMARDALSWVVLQEGERATLLAFKDRRSVAYDAQPAHDERGLRQLLQRQLLTDTPTHAAVWRVGAAPQVTVLEALAPEALVHVLPSDYWDRHA